MSEAAGAISALQPLAGLQVVVCALNLPGPATGTRLRKLGATVVKFEPESGDPFAKMSADWYRELHRGIDVIRCNLKDEGGQRLLREQLEHADILVTSFRPESLRRLRLDKQEILERYLKLCYVAIVGDSEPFSDLPGHDLTYQARAGLLQTGRMPPTLIADLAGVEHAVNAALGLVIARGRGASDLYSQVSLGAAAAEFARPATTGLTSTDGLLGGSDPFYSIHETKAGLVAVGALEDHFRIRLVAALGLGEFDAALWSEEAHRARLSHSLRRILATKTALEWEQWAMAENVPLVAVRQRE